MPQMINHDLRTNSAAAEYVKDETVQVTFAAQAGELISREGPNKYAPGDAIITSSTGDQWVVSRDRFDAKYDAVAPLQHGQAGAYRNKPSVVLALRVDEPFQVARSDGGDVLTGNAGDWFVQYAPGDYGLVEQARFAQVYRRVTPAA